MAFDPEGDGYDMDTAVAAGITADETGHWPSRNPTTGQILKGRKHKTFNLTEDGEKAVGNEIRKGPDGRYYSSPRKGKAYFDKLNEGPGG